MSKRKIILATLVLLLILSGVVAFKLWAAQKKDEEILAKPKKPVAKATATPSTVMVGQIVKFDGSKSYDKDTKVWKEWDDKKKRYIFKRKLIDGVVKKWKWKFGDGESGSGKTVSHKYQKAKKYTAKLTITADHKETASTTVKVTVVKKREEGDFCLQAVYNAYASPSQSNAEDVCLACCANYCEYATYYTVCFVACYETCMAPFYGQ